MLENSKTDKRRLEEFSDSLKFYFPASKVSLPNKRARIEAMPDIFEVIDESRSLSCKSFTDSVEGDDSCERNKDDQKHLIRSSREELLERNQMQQRQDDGKFLVDYLKITNNVLLGNKTCSRIFRNGRVDKSFAVERSENSFGYVRRAQQGINGHSSQNRKYQRSVKVLRPKIRFNDDWYKDVHFGSDEDTDKDAHEPHLSRVYPLRNRIQSGAVSTSETENANCIPNSSCRNDEGIDDHQHVNWYERSKTVESKRLSDNKKKIQMSSNRIVEKTQRQRLKEKLEVMEGFGSGDNENWTEQEIEKLQL